MAHPQWQQLAQDLFLFSDTCNVYLLRHGDRGIAVDFGSGAWRARLDEIGVARLEHVVLTHGHRDQLYGLYRGICPDATIHAPAADAPLLQPASLEAFWKTYQANGCPASYAAPLQPLPAARFSGDNYQPPTRWNGTGGFCSFNGSRFPDGFARSAQRVLDIAPEIICNGHGCVYRFAPGHYRRILRWSQKAERAVQALCPSPSYLADYDCRAGRWEPFVTQAKPGQHLELSLVFQNHFDEDVSLTARPAPPDGWTTAPEKRRARVPAGKTRRLKFSVEVPRKTPGTRHLLAADLEIDGHLHGEACVAIVDIT